MEQAEQIATAYVAHVLVHNQRPASVQQFAARLDLTESQFYQSYASFAAVEAAVFQSYFEEAIAPLASDADYAQYDVATKILSVYFTWLESLTQHRSFVQFIDRQASHGLEAPRYQRGVKIAFSDFVRRILKQGMESGEIADRWFLTRYYKDLLWGNARFVFNYWLHDSSRSFERTDAAIEKSVRFLIELMRPNAVDAGADLARFLVSRNQG
jgi:AcrR family transcriptional regulator